MKKLFDLLLKNLKILIALLCLLFSVAIYFFYQNEKKATIESKENALKMVANFKIDQISAWYVDEVLDIDLISRDETLAELVDNYLRSRNDFNKRHLVKFMNQIKTEHLYADVMLFTLDGKGLLSSDGQVQTEDTTDSHFLNRSILENRSLNTDFFKSVNHGKVYLDFIATVVNDKNQKLAGLICRKDPDEFLNPLIKAWPGSAKSATTYLVRNDSSLKPLKYYPNQAMTRGSDCWLPFSDKDEISVMAFKRYEGIVNGKDESGLKVTSFVSPIPETPWSIVLKVDSAELYGDFRGNMTKVVVIAILLIIILLIGVTSIFQHRREKYLKNLLAKEMDLRQYQERFDATLDILGEGVCLFKAEDQSIVLTNPKMDEMFGFESGELTGQCISRLFAPTDLSQVEIAGKFISSLDKDKVLNTEFLNVRKDGSCFWTTARVYLLTHDKFGPVWIGVFQDITEKKIYEEKLIQSEASYKTMFENNPHPMWVHDAETLRFLSVNNTAVNKYGYSAEEFLSMSLGDLIPPEDLEEFKHFSNSKDGQKQTFVCRHKLRSGEIIYVETAFHNISFYSINARLVLANDVTKTLRYEAELIAAKEKAEKSERLKTAFLANMSHEIRTPLNGIIGFSQLLNEGEPDREEVRQYSSYIVSGGNRLLGLLSNILNVSKIESGVEDLHVNDFIVNDFISNIFTQFLLQAREKEIEYKLNIPGESGEIRLTTDIVKLGQILTNFLSNAFKFTRHGYIELGYECTGTDLEFFVKDSGIGIDEEQQELIFDRFYQADNSFSSGHEGAGLGLAICKGFARLMNARIRVESVPSAGSAFFLTLPLNQP